MAQRLLSGVGAASLVAYRHDPERAHGVLAHGLTDDGHLVIALPEGGVPGHGGGQTHIRLDVRREATEARVRIVAATVHLLGRVEWVDDDTRSAAIESGCLPDDVALVAGIPGMLLGLVRCERVLLHDASGVTPFPWDELASAVERPRAFPGTSVELEAQEAVASLPSDELRALCSAVADGRTAGRVLSERPSRAACDSTRGRVFCVDVDAVGVNLMRVEDELTSVVFVRFTEPVSDVTGLRRELATLRARAGQRGAQAGQRGA